MRIRDELLPYMPTYHTRAMRREFIASFGRVSGTKSAVLREAYKRLTGDASAATNASEKSVDQRIQDILDHEDLVRMTS